MKNKLLSMIVSVGIVVSTSTLTTVYADNDISVKLNGHTLQFDVKPQIINDYTMVPMRTIFEALGYLVKWNPTERMVTAYAQLTDLYMAVKIDNNLILAGDYTDLSENNVCERIYVEETPKIIEESTFVPVRAISEASGCDVQWNSDTRTVSIETPKSIKENSAKAIKNYLIYNYNTMTINGQNNIMRYRVYRNITNSLPFDYNIAVRPSNGIELLKTIKLLNNISNDEKQQIIDAYSGFEETLAKDLVSRMPSVKF